MPESLLRVLNRLDLYEELSKLPELSIRLVAVVRQNRDSVIQIVPVGVEGVINNHQIRNLPVGEYPQVLDVDALRGLHAMLSEQAIGDILVFGVQQVQDNVRVRRMGGSENHYLEML